MRRLLVAGALLAMGAGPQTADWPCVQRLVPTLAAGTLWPGAPPAADWHADPALATLVVQLTDRQMPIDDALTRLRQFVAETPADEKRAELFAALVDGTNVARGEAIGRLREIDRRLRSLADANARATTELNGLPDATPAAARDEVADRRRMIIREYDSINRTVRYGCEIPGVYEARLGRFAQILAPTPP